MTERINFKLAYNGVIHKFGSELTDGNLFYALKNKVASLVKEFAYELFWNDDDSNILLESCADLYTAIDFAKAMRSNPNSTPCVLLTVSSTKAATHQHVTIAPIETAPVDPIAMIKQYLRNLLNSALECFWTTDLHAAMKPLYCPRTKRLQKPSKICAAEIAVELAKLERMIPGEVKDRLKKIPIKDLRKLMNVELLGREETTSDYMEQFTDPKVVAATAVMLAVELSLEQPWVDDAVEGEVKLEANVKNEELEAIQMCPELQKQLKMGEFIEDPEIINQLREEYDEEFDKVHTMICPDGKEIYVLTSDRPTDDAQDGSQAKDDFGDDESECSAEDDYEKEVDELEPDCWITKRATSILELANQFLDSAYSEVLYDSPEEFLRKAKADEVKTSSTIVSEKERLARMRQRLRMIKIAAPALPRSSLVEMERQIASLDLIEYEEHPELRGKWPSTRTNIAALIQRTLDGIPEEMVTQLEVLSAGELARIVLLNCKDRITMNSESAWFPSNPQALLYVCAAAAIYPKEIRHAITATIKQDTATIDAKYEKKYGKDYVQKDKAARAVLSLELAKYMSYEKCYAFERLMLPAQLTIESETVLKQQNWASLIKSFNMTSEMRSFATEDDAVHDEIVANLFHRVRYFNSKTLGKWERRGVAEYAANLYDEWMENVYQELKWEMRNAVNLDMKLVLEPLVTMCSPSELAAILIIGAAAELSPSDMHIDLAEYNVTKSEKMAISQTARTFAGIGEAVSNGVWADTTIPTRQLIPWLDRLAYAILDKGLEVLEPVLAMLPCTEPVKEKHEAPVPQVIERVLNSNAVLMQHEQSLQHLENDTPAMSENDGPVQHAAARNSEHMQQVTHQDEAGVASARSEACILQKPQFKTYVANAEEIATRERELRIREKALQIKEEVFEKYVAEFGQKMKLFEAKHSELNLRLQEADNTEDIHYFDETANNMQKRLMKMEKKIKKMRRIRFLREEDDLVFL